MGYQVVEYRIEKKDFPNNGGLAICFKKDQFMQAYEPKLVDFSEIAK